MHKFLKAIGFTDLRKKDMDLLIKDIVDKPEVLKVTTDSEGNEFAEMSCEYGKGFGITVCGIYDENDEFCPEYYYPYLEAKDISTEEYVSFEKHADKESYAGVCDEIRLGVTLIFYLQNVADYLAEQKLYGSANSRKGAKLAALASEGKILFPVVERNKDASDINDTKQEHNRLVAQAREGDEEAIESLTIEDMDTYSILSQRVQKEDIFSIVTTSFMPYGIESDQYSVLGDIMDYQWLENYATKERVCVMKILCNDIPFSVCINEEDLLGEPAIGRRFRGNIWLQGSTV